jgi:glycosyltransferase involved in cell wall biosynthesis
LPSHSWFDKALLSKVEGLTANGPKDCHFNFDALFITATQNAMAPLVSIILPAYNAEKTVADAITSILLQTYSNWELLFIDDGSSDATLAIARKFAADPRIKILADGRNKKLTARLNEGIDQGSGKYFARMDADDICFPDRLARQVAYLEAHPEIDLLGTGAILFNDAGNLVGLFPLRQTHAEICRRPWNGFYLPHPTWMGRAEWFKKYRYRIPEVEKAEDQELLLHSYPHSRFACLPEMLLAYRMREAVSLRINRPARKNWLRAQLREFSARSEWLHLMLALLVYAAKYVADSYCALAGRNISRSASGAAAYLAAWDEIKLQVSSRRAGVER